MANRNIDKKYHFLYKTTNLINSKYYYGIHSTNEIEDGYLGSGVYLTRAVRKYGKENFKREILQMFDNREELIQAEIDLITKEMIQDKYCMNINFGGDSGSLGMVTVKDKDGNKFSVFYDDPRYISGELVGVTKGFIKVRDKEGKIVQVSVTDPKFLSGELVGITKGFMPAKDKNGNTFQANVNDPRFLTNDIMHVTKNIITIKDKNNNTFSVSINDPRYLSGELKPIWKDKKHTEEAKKKMSESNKGQNLGEKNGSYGTCWITNNNENKKIKKEELESYIQLGWSKGRKIKY